MQKTKAVRRAYRKFTFCCSKGFTLVELLVVVVIMGILGAIMLPQYQRAVLKSRYAGLMPIAKAMADSNEAYFLEHGIYAGNAQDLPVQGRRNYPDGTTLEFGTTSDYSYVLATRDNNFPNNYIVYQKHSGQFPGEIHCEADANDTQAQEVCKSYGPTEDIGETLTSGYLTYVLFGTGDGVAPSENTSSEPSNPAEPQTPPVTKMTAEEAQAMADLKCSNISAGACVGIANDDGTVSVCELVSGNGKIVDGTCDCKIEKGRAGYYEYTYDAAGNKVGNSYCRTEADYYERSSRTYNADGGYTEQWRYCDAAMGKDMICTGGYSSLYSSQDYTEIPDTKMYYTYYCDNTDGDCSTYSHMVQEDKSTTPSKIRSCKSGQIVQHECKEWKGWKEWK